MIILRSNMLRIYIGNAIILIQLKPSYELYVRMKDLDEIVAWGEIDSIGTGVREMRRLYFTLATAAIFQQIVLLFL